MNPVILTQPYKGTRDFYPEDLKKRTYLFETWRRSLTQLGYSEYDTSILENAEIYTLKSGAELGGSQLYSFTDKGDRLIALRPEMTPSLSRIVAQKYEQLRFPLRWFSIPNVFRYERPQKGRLREHWQLNVDIIGLPAGGAELEIMMVIGQIFQNFGANRNHFKIMYNHRGVLDSWLETYQIKDKSIVYQTLDDWYKVSPEEKATVLSQSLTPLQVDNIFALASKTGQEWEDYYGIAQNFNEIRLIQDLISHVHPDQEYEFSPTIIRGIAYYTGIVFEAFDKQPDNPRSLLGGGRYDDLLSLFGKESPAIGFGCGDVTMSEFLTGWNLWPIDILENMSNSIGIMPYSVSDLEFVYQCVIPDLIKQKLAFDIDYDYNRSENKRYETLKKRGCTKIIKIKEGALID